MNEHFVGSFHDKLQIEWASSPGINIFFNTFITLLLKLLTRNDFVSSFRSQALITKKRRRVPEETQRATSREV